VIEKFVNLLPGVTVEIPIGTPHGIICTCKHEFDTDEVGAEPYMLKIMEVSTQHHEEDSFRLVKGD